MPNTLVQGLTDNGSDQAIAGLLGIDLITLVGCLALVDQKKPEATLNIWLADLLDILQPSKNVLGPMLTQSHGRVAIKLDHSFKNIQTVVC